MGWTFNQTTNRQSSLFTGPSDMPVGSNNWDGNSDLNGNIIVSLQHVGLEGIL